MLVREKLSIEILEGKKFKKWNADPDNYLRSAFTHFLHNRKSEVSNFYKKEAVLYVKLALNQQHPGERFSFEVAEKTLLKLASKYKSNAAFHPRKKPKFQFIDLFAGIGGFRTAFQNLGGKCVFTSEWNKFSQKTYEANFGEKPFGDITSQVTKSFIPDGFDVLCAGFPCQAFSIAGRRGGFEDTRGTLFFEVAKIIKEKQPKALFLENVKGLRNHDKGKTLATILNTLRNDLGYYVPEPQTMNAKNFGVPQKRDRIFIIAFRKDLNINEFEYPEATNPTKVLADILEEKEVSVKYYLSNRYWNSLRAHRARHASKGNGFGYEIIPHDGIANAVVCGGMGRERNLIYDHRLTNFVPVTAIREGVNRDGVRKMTPREWARLQGFPDDFRIVCSDGQAYKQFGNSVAVPAIQATAKKLLEKLED